MIGRYRLDNLNQIIIVHVIFCNSYGMRQEEKND